MRHWQHVRSGNHDINDDAIADADNDDDDDDSHHSCGGDHRSNYCVGNDAGDGLIAEQHFSNADY